ncbi:MAG TPA: excinuclease ABC subunit UvrA [Coriobacteriaceae bacterium]|nr:excinuclease ABC subunit UvrA [Coriobacteriaceae bacterium]
MASENIVIKGARQHNLKDIDLTIPRDELIVFTGLSGSGKSSLAFDTIYAEGQRRYVESLSSYARQFLGQMEKPDIDSIDGLSPAVSIDQKTTSKNPRSTVGTTTEIYDYLRLLYARIGTPHCPVCGRVIEKQTADQIADRIMGHSTPGDRIIVMAPVVRGRKGEFVKFFEDLVKEGFSRVRIDGEMHRLDEGLKLDKKYKHDIEVVIDRIVLKESALPRLVEAIETATTLTKGNVLIKVLPKDDEEADAGVEHSSGALAAAGVEGEYLFSMALACPEHDYSMDELNPRDFSFNAPYGACPDCLGLGARQEVDPDLVVPDENLTLEEGAIALFSPSSNYYPQMYAAVCEHVGGDMSTPWKDLPKKTRDALLYGLGDEKIRIDYVTRDGRDTYWFTRWEGVLAAIMRKHDESDSDRTRARLEEFMAINPCHTCNGSRLKPEVLAVTISDKNIFEATQLSAVRALEFFENIEMTEIQALIGKPIVKEICTRLKFLVDVGLDYLTLDRPTATLSGGEAQRIRLATQIGAGLMGVLYILDEPSIGLHQRDNERLIETLKHLRDLGNTVIVVEHDEDTIRSADYVVDIGPGAGVAGGHVVAQGSPADIAACPESITGQYLSGTRSIPVPAKRRNPKRGAIKLKGAKANNLKNVNVQVEIGTLTVVTGVSGSGKSSLVTDTLAPALSNQVMRTRKRVGKHRSLEGVDLIDKVVDIDQSPIGRTPRSNPATYIGVWDDIRKLYASLPESRARGYSAGRFSFNVAGGRCEACKGDGQLKIEMHFLPDIYVPCEVCGGARYNRETLQVTYRGKSIGDLLDMTVAEACQFFENIPNIKRKLQTLNDVGLGYITLGQPATTLSGGEAQRVKLSSELQKVQTGKTFYILDEPTTGLHFEDVRQLLEVLERLVDAGNTVLVIEHNLDIIKAADRIIDLGPEGGDGGGTVVAYGTPEKVAQCEDSHTARFLRELLSEKLDLISTI